MRKKENLEWTIEKILDEIQWATKERTENGVWLKETFISQTTLESIEKVIKDYKLQIDR